jgi:mRNA interferase MazF
LPLRIVVPLTDWQTSFGAIPWFVPIPASAATGLLKDSGADAFQVKSVSESRFIRRIGRVTDDQIDDISSAVAMCVGAP